jgi:hypothetical protein
MVKTPKFILNALSPKLPNISWVHLATKRPHSKKKVEVPVWVLVHPGQMRKGCKSISSGGQYVILHSKMDEENPTYAGLTQDNGFGSA